MGKLTAFFCVFLLTSAAFGQGRGGGSDWVTSGFDAQRSSWVRSDAQLTKDSVQKGFQMVWKVKLDNTAMQLNSLTEASMIERIATHRGFKALTALGASSGTVYAIENDPGVVFWKRSLGTAQAGSLACPGGLTAAPTRIVSLQAQPSPTGAAGAGRGGGRGGRSGGAVGEPGQGAPNLAAAAGPGGGAPAGGRGGAAGGSGGGRGGRGGPAAAAPAQPGEDAPVAVGRVVMGNYDGYYAVGPDGMVHALNENDGSDLVPPVKFLPPGANVSSLMLFGGVLYAGTSSQCGGAANGLWAIDLAGANKSVSTWKSNGGGIVGKGAAAAPDGTLYAATADGDYSPLSYSDTLVALEAKTLRMKDFFTPGKSAFNSSPLVFVDSGKNWVAAANSDGKLYLMDGASVGGADHRTPAFATPKYSNAPADFSAGALASWQDPGGTRWVLAPAGGPLSPDVRFSGNGAVTNGAIVAFKLVTQNGQTTLQPGWASRDMVSPAPPIVVNGIVFALASGEVRGTDANTTVQRSKPAILYALDAATGKELWNSGAAMTSFAHNAAITVGNSQVYVGTWDNTLYAFGFPMERE